MGKSVGSNLFQSFGVFNLGTGDTADFEVDAGTQNVIARVTGGAASTIDGTIMSTIGSSSTVSGANLFFINPAGIMFTANAAINLNGAFVASTANDVKLSDGSIFHADTQHPMDDAGLTSSPVSAFGFMPAANQTPSPIRFTGAQLTSGGDIQVIGGNITLDQGADLTSPGNLIMFSAASSGEVPFSLGSPGAGFANATTASLGTIVVENGSSAVSTGELAGAIVIRGGQIVVDNSTIRSSAENISLTAAGTVSIVDGGSIAADQGYGSGAGVVTVQAASAHLNGAQISTFSEDGSSGEVDFSVTAGLSLRNTTFNTAAVDFHCGSCVLNRCQIHDYGPYSSNGGRYSISATGALTLDDSTIDAGISHGAQPGGEYVTLSAGQIDLNKSQITASVGQGDATDAGDITVTTTSGDLNLQASSLSAGIGMYGGGGGIIEVHSAGTVRLTDGSAIDASVNGLGEGGDITITSVSLLLDESQISSIAKSGGNIVLATTHLDYILNSAITTASYTTGGNITVSHPQLLVLKGSEVSANAATGAGGNIGIFTSNYLPQDNSITATGATNNGSISISAPGLDLAGSLVPLSGALLSNETKLKESCARSVNHESSSLIVVGRGGTESSPDELQPDFGMEDVHATRHGFEP